MKILAIDYATYKVSNLKKSIDFYQNTLGLTLTAQGEDGNTGWAEFEAGGFAVALVCFGEPVSLRGGAGIALAVSDVEGALTELKQKGVKIENEKWETPVCFGASILDPDGNTIYLHKRKDGTVG